jgi:hypothetical protein
MYSSIEIGPIFVIKPLWRKRVLIGTIPKNTYTMKTQKYILLISLLVFMGSGVASAQYYSHNDRHRYDGRDYYGERDYHGDRDFRRGRYIYDNRAFGMGFIGAWLHGSESSDGDVETISRGAAGFYITVWGVYGDFMGWNLSPESSGSGQWREPSCYSFHFGYQFPIGWGWRITPMLGYASLGYTYVDGEDADYYYDEYYDNTSYSSVVSGLDYGVRFSRSYGHFVFNVTCTRHILSAGFGFELGW